MYPKDSYMTVIGDGGWSYKLPRMVAHAAGAAYMKYDQLDVPLGRRCFSHAD
jgi:hypothetical protein